LTALPDPPNLIRLKLEVERRWPATGLVDIPKDPLTDNSQSFDRTTPVI
jgi:hypothetical protein